MDREGLRYSRQDNCLPWIEDVSRAQQLFQEQLTVNWTGKLERFAERLNPLHREMLALSSPDVTKFLGRRINVPKTWGVSRSTGPSRVSPRISGAWQRMRRGVADMFRRSEVSQKINERFYDALAAVDDSTRSANSPETWNSPVSIREGVSVRCISSGPTIMNCAKPLIAESSCCEASESRLSGTDLPTHSCRGPPLCRKDAAVPQLSAASCAFRARTV